MTSTPVIVSTKSTETPDSPKEGGCGCGATSGTDAGISLGLLLLARYLLGRHRAKEA